ncbi:MAG: ATP-binding protein [Fibrobacterales bacterium]
MNTNDLLETNRLLTEKVRALEEGTQYMQQMQMQMVQNERLIAIGQLAAGVAHEINNPLSFVTLNIDHLSEYVLQIQNLAKVWSTNEREPSLKDVSQYAPLVGSAGDLQTLLSETQEGIERIREIVQSLRGFSRVDTGDGVVENNINEGMQSTLVVVQHQIKHAADVEVYLGDIPLVPCNLGEINQVFLNVLVNAVAAIQSSPHERGRIGVRTFVRNESVVCEIENNGDSIEENIVKKIFDPFFTTKRVGEGTGLGLSISHDIIVNKHNGSLYVDRSFSEGVRFVIELPIGKIHLLERE